MTAAISDMLESLPTAACSSSTLYVSLSLFPKLISNKTRGEYQGNGAHQFPFPLIVEAKPTGEHERFLDGKLGGNSVPGETLFIGPIPRDRKEADSDSAEDDQG